MEMLVKYSDADDTVIFCLNVITTARDTKWIDRVD